VTTMHSIGRDVAIRMAESNWWDGLTPRQICDVQLFTEELCLPFQVFHKALGEALGRPVFTHELAGWDRIVQEYLGERPAPTLTEILGMFPAGMNVDIVVAPDRESLSHE
jgi:hypothetical protein